MQQFLMNASFNMKNVTFVPLSGLSGANVVKKPAEGDIPWYKGQTLLEVLGTSFLPPSTLGSLILNRRNLQHPNPNN